MQGKTILFYKKLVIFIILNLILLFHSYHYKFLTDDAFISFRYAKNFAEGKGLVFNEGERVEGYTNFLWVLILSFFYKIGLNIENASIILSFILTMLLIFYLFFWFSRNFPELKIFFLFLPLFFLSITRSFAVWTTSGLETRLFEFLIIFGILRFYEEINFGKKSISFLIFSLASLTRPDGILICFSVYFISLILFKEKIIDKRNFYILSFIGYLTIVFFHFLFRLFYYKDIFPNTFYAKVGGEFWFKMGFYYFFSFILEYGILFWIPLIYFAFKIYKKIVLFLLFPIIIHSLYVIAIGGDHFEYRPYDLYFPFLYIICVLGLNYLQNINIKKTFIFIYILIITFFIFYLPFRSHIEHPKDYYVGFPGMCLNYSTCNNFLNPKNFNFLYIPSLHQKFLREITKNFVGLRQETHKKFLETLKIDAKILNELISEGKLKKDSKFAFGSVGYIGFKTDLKIVDVLGLTDSFIGKQKSSKKGELLAHSSKPLLSFYFKEKKVDFLSGFNPHPVLSLKSEDFIFTIENTLVNKEKTYFVPINNNYAFLVILPQGYKMTKEKYPNLDFYEINYEFMKNYLYKKICLLFNNMDFYPRENFLDLMTFGYWHILSLNLQTALDFHLRLLNHYPDEIIIYLRLNKILNILGKKSQADEILLKGINHFKNKKLLDWAKELESFRK